MFARVSGVKTIDAPKRNPHVIPGRNRTLATLVGGKHSHHCAIPPCENFSQKQKTQTLYCISDTDKQGFKSRNAQD